MDRIPAKLHHQLKSTRITGYLRIWFTWSSISLRFHDSQELNRFLFKFPVLACVIIGRHSKWAAPYRRIVDASITVPISEAEDQLLWEAREPLRRILWWEAWSKVGLNLLNGLQTISLLVLGSICNSEILKCFSKARLIFGLTELLDQAV